MKRYQYVEPLNSKGFENEALTITVSAEWIMQRYYPYWCDQMIRAGKDPEQWTIEDVIMDFCVVNWAIEI